MEAPLTIDVVGDFPRIVEEAKLVPLDGLTSLVVQHLVRDKVLVLANGIGQLHQEGGVRDVPWAETLLVQHGNDPFVTLLHKVANDLVVKVLHWLPLQAVKKLESHQLVILPALYYHGVLYKWSNFWFC